VPDELPEEVSPEFPDGSIIEEPVEPEAPRDDQQDPSDGQVSDGDGLPALPIAPEPELPISPVATTTCNGQPATIFGTNASETVQGTSAPDVIVALGGNDKIFGRQGNDVICAGPGNDTARGGPGFDKIAGELGSDNLLQDLEIHPKNSRSYTDTYLMLHAPFLETETIAL
jgi:Ca2+-binding RTX toxin-like protein